MLCNFFGVCAQASHTVTVLTSSVPSVSLVGPRLRSVFRKDVLTIQATAFTATCNGTISSQGLQYQWSVYDSATHVLLTSLLSESRDPSKLKLASYSLEVGKLYDVAVHVFSAETRKSASATTQVMVQPSSIVAAVQNGNTVSMRLGDRVLLDASPSYDEDVNQLTGVKAGLSFAWSCTQTFPKLSDLCPVRFLGSSRNETLLVHAGSSSTGTASSVVATVTDSIGIRSAQFFLTIYVLDVDAPIVKIANTLKVVNPEDKLVLSGTVNAEASGTMQWSISDAFLALSDISLTPPSVPIQPLTISGATTSTFTSNLVIAAGKLSQRASYTFTLSGILTSGKRSSAQTTIRTNGPPVLGSFAVLPVVGEEIRTQFSFTASNWQDEDLPLSYAFGFISSTGSLLNIQSKSEQSYGVSTLPAGPDFLENVLECVMQVYDSMNAHFGASNYTTVKRSTLSAADLQQKILQTLSDSTGSADGTKQVLAAASSVLNTVNCSLAPNCLALHRNRCSSVAHTCGSCLTGFLGEASDRNTLCVDAVTVFATSSLTAQSAKQTKCQITADCPVQSVCGVDKKCYLPSKACPGYCSGQGVCVYVSVSDVNTIVASCKVTDFTCDAGIVIVMSTSLII